MHRKTVTVLFCDVVGSTALGERMDPEALQALLARYFVRMREIVESHGGSVEKFIGDAVMAVFGVPTVHEDDALRACRAAFEMRDAFVELGVQGCIGVNTGEVVVGTSERLATGDAVNVAARLQHAAEANVILIGAATRELVGEAVDAVAVAPLMLKGKADPVQAYELHAVREAPERVHDAPFVGRLAQLAMIREAWGRASAEQTCQLVTVVGDAGLGKSRLVAEALAGVDAAVVRARCLPYGDGITYWPVIEAVKQLGSRPADPAAATAIQALLGETTRVESPEETAWAFRKLLEQEAPLVVVFDDIQWGDEPFLDLVEALALLSTGVAILVVCMARPELQTRRPEWQTTIRLEPLPAEAVDQLLVDLPEKTRARVASAAGGNPLFVTEMLAMARDGGAVEVPPTLRALLGARLDQLDPQERAVLERGSVEGEVFHRGAVQALASSEVPVSPKLAALVRRQLIRPDRGQLAGDDGFRFRHLLIRDAAYEALPKLTRAELHERFAEWLDEHGADLVELDEIVGYHLEQAAIFRAELGQPDEPLSRRAATRLAAAARRIARPGHDPTTRALFRRAVELTRPFTIDVQLEIDYAETIHWDDAEAAAHIAEAAADRAQAAGDAFGEALARIAAGHYFVFSQASPDLDALESLALETLPLAEATHDDAALVVIWRALGYGVANARGNMARWAEAAEQAVVHARAAGWPKGDAFGVAATLVWGPRPADEALHTLDELEGDLGDTAYDLKRAYLLAALGRIDEAWALATPASERLQELGDSRSFEWPFHIAVMEGDYSRALHYGQAVLELVVDRGQLGFQSQWGAQVGRCLCHLGRFNEAETALALARDRHSAEEWLWLPTRGWIQAARGDLATGERLAREGIEKATHSDMLTFQGDGLRDLAEVLITADKIAEALDALNQALDRYERKKNISMAAQVRARIRSLAGSVANPG